MSSFNLVVLMGRLTRDVEMRYTPKGSAVANLGLAINRKWKSEAGEQREDTTFVEATAWGKTAETMSQYLKKGSPVHISGRLQSEEWEDKQTNQKRSKLKVVVESFSFVGSGDKRGGEAATQKSQAATASEAPPDSDDVPF